MRHLGYDLAFTESLSLLQAYRKRETGVYGVHRYWKWAAFIKVVFAASDGTQGQVTNR